MTAILAHITVTTPCNHGIQWAKADRIDDQFKYTCRKLKLNFFNSVSEHFSNSIK